MENKKDGKKTASKKSVSEKKVSLPEGGFTLAQLTPEQRRLYEAEAKKYEKFSIID